MEKEFPSTAIFPVMLDAPHAAATTEQEANENPAAKRLKPPRAAGL